MLGLPDAISACLFDLDGVLAETGRLNTRAWTKTLNPVLRQHRQLPLSGEDYRSRIHGRLPSDAVRDLLAARGLPASDDTVRDLVDAQAAQALTLIERTGVRVVDGSLRYVLATVGIGLLRVVVSTDPNADAVLRSTGLEPIVDACVDAELVAKLNLAGKPAPDVYLTGAGLVDVPPAQAAVFVATAAGAEAARGGRFAYVVGVNRTGEDEARAMRGHGADVVVENLVELVNTA